MDTKNRKPGRPFGTHQLPRWVEILTVKLPPGAKAELELRAADEGCSVSTIVRRALGFEPLPK